MYQAQATTNGCCLAQPVQQQGQIQDALSRLKRQIDETQKQIITIFDLIVVPSTGPCCDNLPCETPKPAPLTVAQKLYDLHEQANDNNNKLETMANILREQLGEERLI